MHSVLCTTALPHCVCLIRRARQHERSPRGSPQSSAPRPAPATPRAYHPPGRLEPGAPTRGTADARSSPSTSAARCRPCRRCCRRRSRRRASWSRGCRLHRTTLRVSETSLGPRAQAEDSSLTLACREGRGVQSTPANRPHPGVVVALAPTPLRALARVPRVLRRAVRRRIVAVALRLAQAVPRRRACPHDHGWNLWKSAAQMPATIVRVTGHAARGGGVGSAEGELAEEGVELRRDRRHVLRNMHLYKVASGLVRIGQSCLTEPSGIASEAGLENAGQTEETNEVGVGPSRRPWPRPAAPAPAAASPRRPHPPRSHCSDSRHASGCRESSSRPGQCAPSPTDRRVSRPCSSSVSPRGSRRTARRRKHLRTLRVAARRSH